MSDHGAYVTEYLHCSVCYDRLMVHLSARLTTRPCEVVPGHLLSGTISGLYAREEIHQMVSILEDFPACHPVRVAIVAERGEAIVTICTDASGEIVLSEQSVRDNAVYVITRRHVPRSVGSRGAL